MRYTFTLAACVIVSSDASADSRNEPPGIRGYLEEAARIQAPNAQLHDLEHQYGNNTDFGRLSSNDGRIPIENYANPKLILDAMTLRDLAAFIPNFVADGFQVLGPLFGGGIVEGLNYVTENANSKCTAHDGCLSIEAEHSEIIQYFTEPSSAPSSNTLNDSEYIKNQIRETSEGVIQEECGGPGRFNDPRALQVFDFTGDKINDLAIDASGITCLTGMFPLSCGAQFCTTYFYAFEGEYFTPVAEYAATTFGKVIGGDPPIIEVFVHGGAKERISWVGQSFQRQ